MNFINRNYDFTIVFPFFVFLFAKDMSSSLLWDDYSFIFESEKITSAPHPFVYWWSDSGYTRSWPLGYSLLWTLYRIFSNHYIIYKFCNLAIHFFNYILLKKIGDHYQLPRQYKFVFLLFLIHPLNVEPLSWIFQINTLASMTFFILSVLLSIKGNLSKYCHAYYTLSVLFFFGSLLIKSYYVAFAVLFFFIIKNKKRLKILYTSLFLACSIYMTHNTIKGVQYSQREHLYEKAFSGDLIKPHQDEGKPIFLKTTNYIEKLVNRFSLISNNFALYSFNFIFPNKLLFIYSHDEITPFFIFLNSFMFMLFLMVLLFAYSHRQLYKIKIGLTSLLLAFLPISGFFYIPHMKFSPTADHWAYSMIPSFCFILVYILNLQPLKRFKSYRNFLLVGILFFFSAASLSYTKIFNDTEQMLLRNIKYTPSSAFLHAYLSTHYQRKAAPKEAYKHMDQATYMNPLFHPYLKELLNKYPELKNNTETEKR